MERKKTRPAPLRTKPPVTLRVSIAGVEAGAINLREHLDRASLRAALPFAIGPERLDLLGSRERIVVYEGKTSHFVHMDTSPKEIIETFQRHKETVLETNFDRQARGGGRHED